MLRKTSVAAAVIAFATVGSALFGGAALAHEDNDTYTGGAGGRGGDVRQECEQYVDDIVAKNFADVSGDYNYVSQSQTITGNSCTQTGTGGAGGDGGAGQINY
jgi:hypothetical protein